MCIENKEKVGREWPIFLFLKKEIILEFSSLIDKRTVEEKLVLEE